MNLAFKITAAATPLGSTLLTLTKADLEAGSGFRVELAGLGSGRIVINRNRPEATAANLAQDNYVRVYDLDISIAIPLGGFFLDDTQLKVLSLDEEGGEIVQYGGPGALSYFGRCRLWNINYVSFGDDAHFGPRIDGNWYWYNDQYGDILKRMIDEGQDADRPVEGHGIDDLTYDFTSTTDSAGDTWDSFSGNYSLPAGTNYLDIAQRLRDVGLTIQVSGDLLMQAYQNFYGVDRTTASFAAGKIRFVNVDGAAGANIVEELPRQSHPSLQLSRVLVQGDSGDPATMVTRDAASYNVAREGFAQYPSSHALATLQAVGDQALQIRSDSSDVPNFRHIAGLDALNGLYTPFPPGNAIPPALVAGGGTHTFGDETWKYIAVPTAVTGAALYAVIFDINKGAATQNAYWQPTGIGNVGDGEAMTKIAEDELTTGGKTWYLTVWKLADPTPSDGPGGSYGRVFYGNLSNATICIGVWYVTGADGETVSFGTGTGTSSSVASGAGDSDLVLDAAGWYLNSTWPLPSPATGQTVDFQTSGSGAGGGQIDRGWGMGHLVAEDPAGWSWGASRTWLGCTIAVAGLAEVDAESANYWIGDLVTLHTGTETADYDEVNLRVYAINWELDDDEWWPRPELGGLLQLAQQTVQTPGVAGVAGSGSGGVVTVTPTPTPPMTVERELTNKSGGAVALGDQVVIDPANDEAFITSTVVGETRQLGIALEDIANNAKGRIALAGYVERVNCVASVTRGQFGVSSGTVKLVKGYSDRGPGAFCEFLTSGTEPSAVLWAQPDPPRSWKLPVRAATTAVGTMASSFENGDTIDGVVLATGDRILIKDQAAGAENGIYLVAASGAPARAVDFKASAEVLGAAVFVTEGTANGNKVFLCTTDAPITLDTTVLVFAEISGGAAVDYAEDADISTQAFGDTPAAGASTTEVAGANHKHGMPANPFVEGVSAKASGTGDVTTTAALQDLTGSSLTLAAGTWVVIGIFDVRVNNGGNDRLFEGHLDVNGSDENDIATLVGVGLDDADRHTAAQAWRVTLSGSQTIKLRAKHSGGATGDFTVLGANTTITAVRPGGVGIPFLDHSGNPDRPNASPNTEDDEFDAGSLDAKWTHTGGGTLSFGGSRVTVHLPASNAEQLLYQAFTPASGVPFTLTAKYTGCTFFEATDLFGLWVGDSGGGLIAACRMEASSATAIRPHREVGGSGTSVAIPGGQGAGVQFYVKLSRDASNVYSAEYSFDGITWSGYGLATGSSATAVARIGLRMGQTSTKSYKWGSCDWFRRT